MSLNVIGQGGRVGIGTCPTRGVWDVQDGPLGVWVTQNNSPGLSEGGLRGLHFDRPSSDLNPHGLLWHIGGVPAWGLGMDYDSVTFAQPDMVILNVKPPGQLSLDLLRCRADTGQIDVGWGVGHPVSAAQFHISTLGPGVSWSAAFDGGLILGGTLAHQGTQVGFYNVTPVSRPLLATGAGHTVDDVITVLQTLGLVRQS